MITIDCKTRRLINHGAIVFGRPEVISSKNSVRWLNTHVHVDASGQAFNLKLVSQLLLEHPDLAQAFRRSVKFCKAINGLRPRLNLVAEKNINGIGVASNLVGLRVHKTVEITRSELTCEISIDYDAPMTESQKYYDELAIETKMTFTDRPSCSEFRAINFCGVSDKGDEVCVKSLPAKDLYLLPIKMEPGRLEMIEKFSNSSRTDIDTARELRSTHLMTSKNITLFELIDSILSNIKLN